MLLIIKKGCAENDSAIRQAAWIAFGRSGASAEDHLALIQSQASAGGEAEEAEETEATDAGAADDAPAEDPGSDDLDLDGDI